MKKEQERQALKILPRMEIKDKWADYNPTEEASALRSAENIDPLENVDIAFFLVHSVIAEAVRLPDDLKSWWTGNHQQKTPNCFYSLYSNGKSYK